MTTFIGEMEEDKEKKKWMFLFFCYLGLFELMFHCHAS
jgi:hypothetical protein